MGFILTPTDESQDVMFVNFWNWRPTAELIATFDLIENERLELLQMQCCGAKLTAAEAEEIADRIEREILATLPREGRVRLDLSITTEPDDFQFYKGADSDKNYSATEPWLRRFVAFCRTCGGFCVD